MQDLTCPSVVLLGVLIGLRHALDADHLVAVSTLVRQGRQRQPARLGLSWGVGHTLTLLGLGGTALLLGLAIPESAQRLLDVAVGGMLLYLGGTVLRRVLVGDLRWTVHRHGDRSHLHAVRGGPPAAHIHRPPEAKAFLVGMVHGLAGSGPLALLAATTATPWHGLVFLVVLGLSSMAGMASLTLAIGLPLRLAGDRRPIALSFQLVSGLVSVVVGLALLAGASW